MNETILREIEQQMRNALKLCADDHRPKTEREAIAMFLGMLEMRIKDGDVNDFELSWRRGDGKLYVGEHAVALDVQLSAH
jgi:hypothetical protein